VTETETVQVELTRKEAQLLAENYRDIQKALAWEPEDDEALTTIGSKCRKALRQ
jgi:hypothetical protein